MFLRGLETVNQRGGTGHVTAAVPLVGISKQIQFPDSQVTSMIRLGLHQGPNSSLRDWTFNQQWNWTFLTA